MDRFKTMKELMASVSKDDYNLEINLIKESNVLIVSPHGGRIEFGTSELSKVIAGNEFNRFDFSGKLKHENFKNLHVTSTGYGVKELDAMNLECSVTLSLHGFKEPYGSKLTLIGGLDEHGKNKVLEELTKNGFNALLATDRFTAASPDNIVNKNKRKMGIQLEISTAQRIAFFRDTDLKLYERKELSDEFYRYAESIRNALLKLESMIKI